MRRDPDSSSELVTQALLNTPATPGEIHGEWTHVTLPDYEGWICTDQLEEPPPRAFCKIGGHCTTALQLRAVVVLPRTFLYTGAQGKETLGSAYLSTVLPLLDTTQPERVQVGLPGERTAWLLRAAVAVRQQEDIFPRMPVSLVTACARLFPGVPYLWGGTSWEGIDCSGFIQLCYRVGGYILPRDADQQYEYLEHSVKREEMQEGDLIFFGTRSITHVAMALNTSEYIHAEGQNFNRVLINSFDPAADHYYARLDEITWGVKRPNLLDKPLHLLVLCE